MPYLLRFDNDTGSTAGDYVASASGVNIFQGDDFSIIIDATPAANADHYRPLGGSNLAAGSPRVICFANGTVRLSGQSDRNWTGIGSLALINTLEFRRVSGRLDLFVNGVQAAGGFEADNNAYDRIGGTVGGNFGSTSRAFDLRKISFIVNGVLVREYDPGASNGTGSTLIDTVGGNNGTLVNFPTDDSQWIFYSAPSSDVDSTISATWPSLAISADQQSTAPAIESSVNVTWPSLAIAANQTAQAPEFDSTVTAQWPSLSVQAAQTATAPVYTSEAAITWPRFTVQVSQGAQVPDVDSTASIAWPTLSVTANQASILPAYGSAITATWPSLSISATQSQQLPEGATTVNVTWPIFSVNINQNFQEDQPVTPPNLFLFGGDVFLEFGIEYVEPGFQALDSVDGDITGSVNSSGTIDSQTPGRYRVDYSVTNSNSLTTTASRFVTVRSQNGQQDGFLYARRFPWQKRI